VAQPNPDKSGQAMKPMLHSLSRFSGNIPSRAVSQLSTLMEFKDFADVTWKVFRGTSMDSYRQYGIVLWLIGLAFLAKPGILKDIDNILPGPFSEQFNF
jgi:hypothetical protein